MTAHTPSTIAQLLFRTRPALDFARIVGDLELALDPERSGQSGLHWDHEDIAIFDQPGSRILLGYVDGLSGAHDACLTVSVGQGPDPMTRDHIAMRKTAVAQMIVDRITDRYTPDDMRWHDTPHLATDELVDRLIDALDRPLPRAEETADEDAAAFDDAALERLVAEAEAGPVTHPAAMPAAAPAGAKVVPLAREVAGLREIDRRDPGPATLGRPAAVANDVAADTAIAEAQAIRDALYAEAEDERPSTRLRLSAHAMNASLLALSLPLGAAMMTYTFLRGESVTASARAMAIGGMGIGLVQSGWLPGLV